MTMNLSFLIKIFRDILLAKAKIIIIRNNPNNKIRLCIIKINIVSNTRKMIFDIGFNLCNIDVPGKNAKVNNL